MTGEHTKPREALSEDLVSRPPRNRGLIARDLTVACHDAWKGRGSFYSGGGYVLDRHPEVADAERAVCDRIGELEDQVERQAKIIERMREISERLEREVSLVLKVMKP